MAEILEVDVDDKDEFMIDDDGEWVRFNFKTENDFLHEFD